MGDEKEDIKVRQGILLMSRVCGDSFPFTGAGESFQIALFFSLHCGPFLHFSVVSNFLVSSFLVSGSILFFLFTKLLISSVWIPGLREGEFCCWSTICHFAFLLFFEHTCTCVCVLWCLAHARQWLYHWATILSLVGVKYSLFWECKPLHSSQTNMSAE